MFMRGIERWDDGNECDSGSRPAVEPVPDGLVLPVLALRILLSNNVPACQPIRRWRRRQRCSAAEIGIYAAAMAKYQQPRSYRRLIILGPIQAKAAKPRPVRTSVPGIGTATGDAMATPAVAIMHAPVRIPTRKQDITTPFHRSSEPTSGSTLKGNTYAQH